MRSKRIQSLCRLVALLVTVCAAMSGCGQSEAEESEASAREVDARFASAQALVDYFNSLNTKLPRDLPNLVPLYHIETDFQRKKLQLMVRESKFATHDLEVAMYARFGESLAKPGKQVFRACTPAVLKKAEEFRAEGVFKDWLGKERPLHLIKVDNRWWVSGYTLEYETDTDKRELVEGFSDLMLSLEVDTEFVRPLVAQVRAGEFASAEEARAAFMQIMKARWAQNRPVPN